jgi:hypothetical protein
MNEGDRMADFDDMLVQLRTELATLQAREAKIIDAIHALEGTRGTTPTNYDPDAPKPYRNHTKGDAVSEILKEVGPLTTREIADKLLAGGMKTKATNFVATLYTALYKDGRFQLKDQRWHLKHRGGR